MKHIFPILLLSILLASCGLAPASLTVTPTAAATFTPTATKAPTATATATEKPIFVNSDVKEALGKNYRIENDGSVVAARTGRRIPELKYLSGYKMQMAYEFAGDPDFKFFLEPANGDIKVLRNGDLDLPGWLWVSKGGEDGKGEMVRQRFSLAKGKCADGADCEGINAEYGETLYNVAEVQKLIISTGDMTKEARRDKKNIDRYFVFLTDYKYFKRSDKSQPDLKENLDGGETRFSADGVGGILPCGRQVEG